MKKIKLMLVAMIAILFMGVGSVNAQESKSVLIQYHVMGIKTKKPTYIIQTVEPNYTTYMLSTKDNGGEALIELKKEIDKWQTQGYYVTQAISMYEDEVMGSTIVQYILTYKEK